MSEDSRISNGDSARYWEGARAGQLLLQRCRSCETIQFPPRHHCEACWEAAPEWVESSGRGRVESFTVVRRAPMPSFRDRVPYVVAALWLDEGVRMITNVVGDGALEVAIGDRVRVTFEADGNGDVLPQFMRDAVNA